MLRMFVRQSQKIVRQSQKKYNCLILQGITPDCAPKSKNRAAKLNTFCKFKVIVKKPI